MDQKQKQQFAQNLRYYMKQNDLIQADIASKMEVSTAIVTEWVKGRKLPRVDKIQKLANIFGCEISELIDGPKSEVAKMQIIDSQIQRLYDSLPADKQKQAMDFLWFLKQGSVDKP